MTAHRTSQTSVVSSDARRPSLLATLLLVTLLLAPQVAAHAEPDARRPTGASSGYALPLPAGAGIRSLPDLRASGLLVAPFDAPAQRWSPGHRGVDLAHLPGADVLAPQDGVVSFVGFVVDRPLLVITHPDGLRSTLEPVETLLAQGSTVLRGDVVGTTSSGIAHCPPRTCVHWGVRRGDEYIDPLTLLGLVEPVVLLPDR